MSLISFLSSSDLRLKVPRIATRMGPPHLSRVTPDSLGGLGAGSTLGALHGMAGEGAFEGLPFCMELHPQDRAVRPFGGTL